MCRSDNPYASPEAVDDAPSAPSEVLPDDLGQPQQHYGSGGVCSPSFLGLLFTQFLGAMNDNLFRWLTVWIGKDLVGENASAAVSAGLALLVLPFMLFMAPAGYLADRFSKRNVIVWCKVLEVVVMAFGVVAILCGNVYFLFVVLFFMGTQSALFGPSKYGSIPEIVRPDRLSVANGLIGMTTILAIVMGSVTAGYVYEWTKPLGHTNWWISACALLGVAGVGLLTSLMIRPLPVASPERAFPVNLFGQTYRDLASLCSVRPLILAALGSGIFWGLGGLCQVNIDHLAGGLSLTPKDTGPMLAVLALGVGLGNVLAGVVSRGKIELGIVPYSAAGIALFAMLLSTVSGNALLPGGDANFFSPVYLSICGLLLALGISGGMYDVPLQSFLQYRSPEKSRGAILAACNFLTCAAMFTASGIFYLLSGPLGLSGRAIFLALGLAIAPVAISAAWLLPLATVRVAFVVLSRVMYRFHVEGRENIPEEGGAVLTPNHVSWADGLLVGLACPRHIRMLVFADYFERPPISWFGKITQVIPIKPGKRSIVESLRKAREAVEEGELVGVFPEGGLSRDGKLHAFHPGFLTIVKKTGAPVIPIYLEGLWGSIFSFERGKFFWKIPRRWPYPVTIRIGKPIYNPESAEQVRNAVIELGRLRPENVAAGEWKEETGQES